MSSLAPSKIPTLSDMTSAKPSLDYLLSQRPERYRSKRSDWYDLIMLAGLTYGFTLAGIMYLNQSIPIEYIPITVFSFFLTIYLWQFHTLEKKHIELKKEWIQCQRISPICPKLKQRYLKDIAYEKRSLLWAFFLFCCGIVFSIILVAFIQMLQDKDD